MTKLNEIFLAIEGDAWFWRNERALSTIYWTDEQTG